MYDQASLDELRLQLEELRTSAARMLVASDAERRQIECDLHDGAQQHLVALAVNLQLARQLADSDPDAAKTLLDEIARDVREALEDVRRLAQRVYPPLLLDQGLADALRAAAVDARIPTRVEADALERYPPEIEATAYFCCVEALQNAHARATVRAWPEQGALRFDVIVDDANFEEWANGGLTSMRDRLGALGGQLTASFEAGRGACISGSIPLPQ